MHRILLESLQQEDNSFVTLTYRPELQPRDVDPRALQLWLKRVRRSVAPIRLRYFGVGEYGAESWRAHYHVALFGMPECSAGGTLYGRDGFSSRCCSVCSLVSASWGMGRIHVGTLTPHSAGYIAGYVTKKMTRADDDRLQGRRPEFARMSLRPGIGADATWELADAHLQWCEDAPDVATALRHGGRILPLGRYLTQRLRAQTGRPINAPEATLQKIEAEMLDVRMASEEIGGRSGWRLVMKDLLIQKNQGAINNVEGRERIFGKRRKGI